MIQLPANSSLISCLPEAARAWAASKIQSEQKLETCPLKCRGKERSASAWMTGSEWGRQVPHSGQPLIELLFPLRALRETLRLQLQPRAGSSVTHARCTRRPRCVLICLTGADCSPRGLQGRSCAWVHPTLTLLGRPVEAHSLNCCHQEPPPRPPTPGILRTACTGRNLSRTVSWGLRSVFTGRARAPLAMLQEHNGLLPISARGQAQGVLCCP